MLSNNSVFVVKGGGIHNNYNLKNSYEYVKKKLVCGKNRIIYNKLNSKSKKEYIKYKGKYIQIKKFIDKMIESGKWKVSKPYKSNQYKNHKTKKSIKK
tara:strand:- start:424 stop:717 length:294 start_codon:yes stop_codon:yes gene_type:complete